MQVQCTTCKWKKWPLWNVYRPREVTRVQWKTFASSVLFRRQSLLLDKTTTTPNLEFTNWLAHGEISGLYVNLELMMLGSEPFLSECGKFRPFLITLQNG